MLRSYLIIGFIVVSWGVLQALPLALIAFGVRL